MKFGSGCDNQRRSWINKPERLMKPNEKESKTLLKIRPGKERLVAAVAYARMGLHVYPLYGIRGDGHCSCGNPKCLQRGNHPRITDWRNKASYDEATIRLLWGKWPDSDIGILTGAVSGFVVLKVNGKKGEQSRKFIVLPSTLEGRTPSGRQLFFQHPGHHVMNCMNLLPGLDLEGDGGSVVLPFSGSEYDWEENVELAPCPEVLVQLGHSIRPKSDPKSGSLDEWNSDFNPLDLAELLQKPEQHLEWVVDGYGAPGRWTLVAGPPKIGKTTLAYEMAMRVARGKPWLKRLIRQGKVLVLAVEEHHEDVARRFRRLGAGGVPGQIKIVTGPLEFSEKILAEIVKYIEEENIELVLVDTLAAWWHLENENDASQVLRSGRMLLNAIRQTNAAWMCIVHTRKSGGEGGDEIRGSSALLGLVDIAISMKRRPGDPQARVLETVSRFSETPKELVIRYGNNGYEAMGSPDEVSAKGKAEQVFAMLDQTPRSIAEIVEATGLSKQDVSRAIVFLKGQVVRQGNGHKNDPFQYRRDSISPNSPSREEGLDESNLELEEEV
jgi:AAA domain/Bifunctional DNA primase/polymerase, N-terminal